jgi:hypothetical protein
VGLCFSLLPALGEWAVDEDVISPAPRLQG